jgi:hypothetical protein
MRRSAHAFALLAALAASCNGGQTGDEGALNGRGAHMNQPGKGVDGNGANWVPCSTDLDCATRLEQYALTLAAPVMVHRVHLGSGCVPARDGCSDDAFCGCVYDQDGPGGDTQRYVLALGTDAACDLYSRDGTCLVSGKDFAGCDVDGAASCDAACAHAMQVWAADDARTLDVQARSARCVQTACQHVIEVEGMCYPGSVDAPRYDCALDDDDILARAFPDATKVEVLAQCSGQGCEEGRPVSTACSLGSCGTTVAPARGGCTASGAGGDAGAIPDRGETP